MRRIAIIGAGQSGLQLALGLVDNNYEVTLVSDRAAEQIRAGRVLTSQCMFDTALRIERDRGLGLWDAETPNLEGLAVTIGDGEGGAAIRWAELMARPAQSTDQRLKMSAWLDLFETRGGTVLIMEAGLDELEALAQDHDLVIVASGKGEIGGIFERDDGLSPFDRPMRALGMIYLQGLAPRTDFNAVSINIAPGIGEMVTFPALTTTGVCDIVTFEGIPEGPLDCWDGIGSMDAFVERARAMVERYFPWEAWRLGELRPTDQNCTLRGRFAPVVRKPVARLASGAHVLGLADAVVLNDPIAGQGSNNASRAAEIYLDSILEHADRPFDAAWMQETFEHYWVYAKWATDLSNAMLVPPADHVIDILGAAQDDPRIARAVAHGFDEPVDFDPWFFDADEAGKFLKSF